MAKGRLLGPSAAVKKPLSPAFGDRPPVRAERNLAFPSLGSLLGCVVMRRAERGKVAGVKEEIGIAAVRRAVVDDACASGGRRHRKGDTRALAAAAPCGARASARCGTGGGRRGPRGCGCRASSRPRLGWQAGPVCTVRLQVTASPMWLSAVDTRRAVASARRLVASSRPDGLRQGRGFRAPGGLAGGRLARANYERQICRSKYAKRFPRGAVKWHFIRMTSKVSRCFKYANERIFT